MGWSSTRHGHGAPNTPTADSSNSNFQSNEEIFEWVAESRFYDARNFRARDVPGMTKVKAERTMYASFIQWSEERPERDLKSTTNIGSSEAPREEVLAKNTMMRLLNAGKEEALVRFGKKDELDAFMHDFNLRTWFKQAFTGTKVGVWTDMERCWKEVKVVMDLVRTENDTENLRRVFDREGEEGLRRICLNAKEKIGYRRDPESGRIVQENSERIVLAG